MTFSYLTKSDRRMILLLIVVVAAAFVVFFIADSEQPPAELQPVATATRPAKRHKPTTRYYHQGSPRQPRLAPFDPNRADSTELLQLGLPPFIVRNIYKYRAKILLVSIFFVSLLQNYEKYGKMYNFSAHFIKTAR